MTTRGNALPARVVVGANGAYWRDFGDGYSMCPVSTDNDPVVVTAVYVPALDAERLARALFEAERPGDWPTWDDYVGAFGSAGIAQWRRKADRILALLP